VARQGPGQEHDVTDPQGRQKDEQPVERFHATSGQVTGVVALVVAGAVVVVGLVYGESGYSVSVVLGAVLFGLLTWVVMLRPRVWATDEHLVMRNILRTEWIPLAAIEQVAVRQVLAVRAGDRRFVSPAIGKSRRQIARPAGGNNLLPGPPLGRGSSGPASTGEAKESATTSYPVFVEERISHLAAEARTRQGVQSASAEQAALAADVRRAWAWPEIAALVAAAVALVVSLFI
jgi:hypothetical protein